MNMFKKKIEVKANTIGYLIKNNVLDKKLEAGIYKIWDLKDETELISFSSVGKMLTVVNQEVLTKDNIAFRFSFYLVYKIVDGEKFLSNFPLDKHINMIVYEAEQRVSTMVQLYIKNKISSYESEELNEKRSELQNLNKEDINKDLFALGVEIEEFAIKDLTFPKSIQDLFAKHLEAKIRAKSDLENARTAVATARTLKNASELMKDDENIRFFQMIETISKIAEKGKHTFMIGDMNQLVKK